MELSAAHLRYLLAIYEAAATQRDISSRTIAERLGVTRPSVARALGQLMERGMIVKAHYGKIYLTDRGVFVARRGQRPGGGGLGDLLPLPPGPPPTPPARRRRGSQPPRCFQSFGANTPTNRRGETTAARSSTSRLPALPSA